MSPPFIVTGFGFDEFATPMRIKKRGAGSGTFSTPPNFNVVDMDIFTRANPTQPPFPNTRARFMVGVTDGVNKGSAQLDENNGSGAPPVLTNVGANILLGGAPSALTALLNAVELRCRERVVLNGNDFQQSVVLAGGVAGSGGVGVWVNFTSFQNAGPLGFGWFCQRDSAQGNGLNEIESIWELRNNDAFFGPVGIVAQWNIRFRSERFT